MATMTVRKCNKRTARKRYDAGLPIAMAAETWWFDVHRESSTFTRDDMGGVTFDALLHTARGDARYSYAHPVEVAAHVCWTDDTRCPRC